MNGSWSIRFLIVVSLASVLFGVATLDEGQADTATDAPVDENDFSGVATADEADQESSPSEKKKVLHLRRRAQNLQKMD